MCLKVRRVLKNSLRVQEYSSVKRQLSLSAQTLKILRPTSCDSFNDDAASSLDIAHTCLLWLVKGGCH